MLLPFVFLLLFSQLTAATTPHACQPMGKRTSGARLKWYNRPKFDSPNFSKGEYMAGGYASHECIKTSHGITDPLFNVGPVCIFTDGSKKILSKLD